MADDDSKQAMTEFLDFLGKLIAIIMIIRYGALIVEHYYPFLPTEGIIYDIINYIGLYSPMALMLIVGLEAVWDKAGIAKTIIVVLCIALVIFTFFPDVWSTIMSYTGVNIE